MALLAQPLRLAYRHEVFPAALRWWLAGSVMRDWMRVVARGLRAELDRARSRAVTAEVAAGMFRRRLEALRDADPAWPSDERALALTMYALYHLWDAPKARWILDGAGGGPRSLAEHGRALSLLRRLDAEARWREVTVHLGEFLIVFTETVPERIPRTRQLLAKTCFELGVTYAERTCALFGIDPRSERPERAIEVLRMSEYLFRVNPEHESGADDATDTGYIVGNACPWFDRPGWRPGHCGIFGQFQNGVSSVFGLKYRLTQTIPRHGGDVCRIDLSPIPLRTKPGRSPAAGT
ncbi:MAG TPA: hypothetical protein RMH99_13350 [Sandaracinaceae bacterium LLY-WYZ-13_1]|nr:hypothetical protein [Sandaracinaceae bacterium LLY-WYZ-13_1]